SVAHGGQLALWLFSAALHEDFDGIDGYYLGGIMFDIEPGMQPHRQGTAIFTESALKDAPAGDQAAAAYVARARFSTTVHEMGHAFNLAHSWEKSKGTQWIQLEDEPEERSFMNYPWRVTGGQLAYFANFRYRFS